MRRTRLSLLFVAAYLLPAGVAFAAAPAWALDVLGATGEYGDAMPRLVGISMGALGVMALQVARHRVEALYPGTLALHAAISAGLLAIWLSSRDPAFGVLFAVEAFGVLLSAAAYRLDRRPAPFGRVGRAMDSVETR
jgi:hypothetical protein